jgi:ABC-2 type transport system permease protein
MTKILTIVWKDLYTTYTDRNLLLIMIASPLALASIITLAFSSFFTQGGSDVPVRDIPVAVVNLDQGVEVFGNRFNNGETFVNILVPPENAAAETLEANALFALTNAVLVPDAAMARSGVDEGTYAAAIIIPADYSEKITYSQSHPTIEPVTVGVYASPASPISANIIRSIVESVVNQTATGNIAIAATINALVERAQTNPAFGVQFGLASASGEFQLDFAAGFDPASNPVRIEQQTVQGEATSFNPLILFGSGQAVFFMLFTAMGSANALLEERRDGTLQRLIASPTPRYMILLGKFIGTFTTCVVQVVLLMLALTVIGSLVSGQVQFIWGSNLLALALVVVSVSLAAAGLGTMVASVVTTPDQGNLIGSIISMMMGLFGGVFFSVQAVPVLAPLSRLTIVYWATDAFSKLSLDQTDIGLNLAVLLVIGAVFFVSGWAIFNRRLNV